MFKKFDVIEYIKENKEKNFEQILKEILEIVKPNNFTRIIKSAYTEFKTDFDNLFTKLKQTEFEYINLYLQNKLYKCPVCGRYSKHKTCSKECAKKFPCQELELKELLKTKSFKDSLSMFLNKYGANKFTVIIKKISNSFENELNQLFNEIGKRDFTYINLFLQNKLTKCSICGKTIVKPRIYCSLKCSCKDRDYEEINSKKDYKEIGKRISNSLLERSKEEKELHRKRIEETKFIRYGNKNYLNQEKIKQTNLERYGTEFYCSSNEFKKRIKETMNSKTDEEVQLMIQRVKNTKKEKYNDENYNNSLRNIENKENFLKEYVIENFVKDNSLLFSKFKEYFGISESTVYKYIEKWNLPYKKHKGFSRKEKELFEWIPIKNKISNTKQIITPYELDIYLPDYKLAIEYNGSYWHSTDQKPNDYHLNKTKLCKEKGIDLIHVFEFDDLEIVKSIILDRLNKNTIIDSKECELKSVSKVETIKFLKENDLKGKCKFSRSIGLYFKNQLVQLVCVKKNEIKRITTLKNVKIIGGLTKIIKHLDTKNLIYQSDPRYEKEIKEFKQIKILDKHFIKVYNFTIQDCGKRIYKV